MTANIWTVEMKTGPNTWSTVELEGGTYEEAIKRARAIIGNFPIVRVD